MTSRNHPSSLSGARCLVTGAGGFLGAHLIDRLLEAGAQVIAAARAETPDRGPAGGPHQRSGVTRVVADLRDADATGRMVRLALPTHVFHLAGVRGSSEMAWADLRAGNVDTTLHLLDSLRAEGLRPWILITGSSAVYGPGTRSPLTEDASLRPVSLYGVAKAAQELVAIREEAAFGATIAIARLFNLVGPGQAPSMLIASVARQVAIAERDPDSVVRVGSLSSARDYVDVRDAADALLLLAEANAPSGPYNVASGVARPVRDCVIELLGMGARPVALYEDEGRQPATDVSIQVGDSTRLRDSVDWHPKRAFGASLQDVLDDWRRRTATAARL